MTSLTLKCSMLPTSSREPGFRTGLIEFLFVNLPYANTLTHFLTHQYPGGYNSIN